MPPKDKRNDLMTRVGGLAIIAVIGLLVAACGLSMAFGQYRLSGVFFFITAALLLLVKLVVTILK